MLKEGVKNSKTLQNELARTVTFLTKFSQTLRNFVVGPKLLQHFTLAEFFSMEPGTLKSIKSCCVKACKSGYASEDKSKQSALSKFIARNLGLGWVLFFLSFEEGF